MHISAIDNIYPVLFERKILEVDISSTAGKRRRRRRLARERRGQARGGTQGADQVGLESKSMKKIAKGRRQNLVNYPTR